MHKPKIWIIDEAWRDYEVEKEELRKAFSDVEICYSGYDYHADMEKFGKDADAILAQIFAVIKDEDMQKLSKCKVISVFGGGYDKVDVAAAKKYDIKVAFVPGYCTEDIADYTMAAIFHCNKAITSFNQITSKCLWGYRALQDPPNRATDANLLIIGLGRIGSCVAKKARALGMKVYAYDPYVTESKMEEIGVIKTDFHAGLANADYVSVNAKRTPETEDMIGWDAFTSMKPSAYIINTARGQIIDEPSLIKAVTEKRIAGAVIDVVHTEPPTFKEPIFNTPGILVTPHISYLSVQSLNELKARTTRNAIKILKGEDGADIAL
ncbi:C-terminal binding protein [Cloacibacillus evryensis]|uniref:C-terminal binding protein n=1 Tax=Cloacibacillus evryensis TaxID=508460 RepID=UPI00241F3018|nr:C-terminal binding protein [Cloacibacillus evryensis]